MVVQSMLMLFSPIVLPLANACMCSSHMLCQELAHYLSSDEVMLLFDVSFATFVLPDDALCTHLPLL